MAVTPPATAAAAGRTPAESDMDSALSAAAAVLREAYQRWTDRDCSTTVSLRRLKLHYAVAADPTQTVTYRTAHMLAIVFRAGQQLLDTVTLVRLPPPHEGQPWTDADRTAMERLRNRYKNAIKEFAEAFDLWAEYHGDKLAHVAAACGRDAVEVRAWFTTRAKDWAPDAEPVAANEEAGVALPEDVFAGLEGLPDLC